MFDFLSRGEARVCVCVCVLSTETRGAYVRVLTRKEGHKCVLRMYYSIVLYHMHELTSLFKENRFSVHCMYEVTKCVEERE